MQDVLPHLVTRAQKQGVAVLVPQSEAAGFAAILGVRVFTYRRTGRGPASLLRFAVAILKAMLAFRPNVVHLHSTFSGLVGRIVLLPWFLARRVGVVYTAHGWAFGMAVSSAKRKVYAATERALARITHRITTISQDDDTLAIAHNLRRKNMLLLRNTCKPLVQKPNTTRKHKAKKLSILFVGRFDHQKGLDTFIHALTLLAANPNAPQWQARLVGEQVHGEPLHLPPSLTPHVQLLGWLSRDALGHVMEESDVLVVPSRWEGFGLVALEAMSCGVAVLASRTGGLTEIVIEGETGHLMPPEDAAALHTILATTPRQDWWRMGENGLARYHAEFPPQAMLTRLLGIYQSLL